MLPMEEIILSPPAEECIDAKEQAEYEKIESHYTIVDVTALILSLSHVASLTRETIFHTAA